MNVKRLVVFLIAASTVITFNAATAAEPSSVLPPESEQPNIKSPDEAEATAELREAIRLDPNFADARVALGVLLMSRGDLTGAIAELRQAVRLKPDHVRARYNLGLALIKQRDEIAQVDQARAASSKEPVLAEAYLDLAKAYIDTGNFPDAVAELREALRLQPNFTEAQINLAMALFNMGDVEGAIEVYRDVLRVQPELGSTHVGLGIALMAKHDWPGARAELQEAVRLQPDLLQAHYSLGMVRYTQGDIRGAIESYRRAVELRADYGDAHYNLGLLLKMTDRTAEAVQEFRVAAESGLAKAQYFLGNAYASGTGVEKNLAVAVTWWSRAAEQGLVQARESLAQLRRVAVLKGKHATEESRAALQAFRTVQTEMWTEFPDVQGKAGEDSIGVALVRQGQVTTAVPILIREALLLKEAAYAQLETLFDRGVDGQLMAHDPRILAYFKAAATEGIPRARLALARIYARGVGVPQDMSKALSLLKETSDDEAQRLLKEIVAAAPDSQQATRIVQPTSTSP
jgi:Tfp pilus assembly protein PilF